MLPSKPLHKTSGCCSCFVQLPPAADRKQRRRPVGGDLLHVAAALDLNELTAVGRRAAFIFFFFLINGQARVRISKQKRKGRRFGGLTGPKKEGWGGGVVGGWTSIGGRPQKSFIFILSEQRGTKLFKQACLETPMLM